MLELSSDTLVVFVSDSHIGGDPGCDGFESPAELEALFEELRAQKGPVELILAGDFFDFLQIGKVPDGEDRASLTMDRPEYRDLFAALGRFREAEGKRVIYLPGNHDAESFWNPGIQKTLRERGLVDEFAYYYLASVETGEKRRDDLLRAREPAGSCEHRRGLPRFPGHAARPPRRHGLHASGRTALRDLGGPRSL